MRTEQEIIDAIDAASAIYNESVTKDPAHIANAHGKKVKELRQELCDTIAHGAAACPDCGTPPHGMRRYNSNGERFYQISCLTCVPVPAPAEPTSKIRPAASGLVPELAVMAWNAGVRIVVSEAGRIVGVVKLGERVAQPT